IFPTYSLANRWTLFGDGVAASIQDHASTFIRWRLVSAATTAAFTAAAASAITDVDGTLCCNIRCSLGVGVDARIPCLVQDTSESRKGTAPDLVVTAVIANRCRCSVFTIQIDKFVHL